jgi:hypothetical protein
MVARGYAHVAINTAFQAQPIAANIAMRINANTAANFYVNSNRCVSAQMLLQTFRNKRIQKPNVRYCAENIPTSSL